MCEALQPAPLSRHRRRHWCARRQSPHWCPSVLWSFRSSGPITDDRERVEVSYILHKMDWADDPSEELRRSSEVQQQVRPEVRLHRRPTAQADAHSTTCSAHAKPSNQTDDPRGGLRLLSEVQQLALPEVRLHRRTTRVELTHSLLCALWTQNRAPRESSAWVRLKGRFATVSPLLLGVRHLSEGN